MLDLPISVPSMDQVLQASLVLAKLVQVQGKEPSSRFGGTWPTQVHVLWQLLSDEKCLLQ